MYVLNGLIVSKSAREIDKRIGHLVRFYRIDNNISQKELAEYIGVSFQQLQKYESATNRVSAGTLFLISEKLEIPISEFFDHQFLL